MGGGRYGLRVSELARVINYPQKGFWRGKEGSEVGLIHNRAVEVKDRRVMELLCSGAGQPRYRSWNRSYQFIVHHRNLAGVATSRAREMQDLGP